MTTFAQGEIYVRKLDQAPAELVAFDEKNARGEWIISHSESGHHHLLEADGVTVMERKANAPAGVQVLIAIVENPSRLYQDAGNAHEAHDLSSGIYEMRIAREYDPFTQQARRVAD